MLALTLYGIGACVGGAAVAVAVAAVYRGVVEGGLLCHEHKATLYCADSSCCAVSL